MLNSISQINRIKLFAFLIPIAWLIIGYFHVTQRVEELHTQKNNEVFQKMQDELKTLIDEKKETILIIAMAISNNSQVKQTLSSQKVDIALDSLSTDFRKNTSLKNIWFQIVSAEGISLYRSWTKKSGDNLTNVRLDVKEMIQEPKILSTISVGKFDLSFKSMVPLYEGGKFIGLVEVIAKFNSIAAKMNSRNYDTVFLVDKKYKKQLTTPFTKKFIDDYYVANFNVKSDLLKFVKKKGVEHFVNRTFHHKCIHSNKLVITHHLKDINNQEMGYFVVFQDMNLVNRYNINQIRDRLTLFYVLVFIVLSLLIYYAYKRKYKTFINNLNEKLETEILKKTKVMQEQSDKLEYIANHDALTKLPNRLLFLDRLKQNIKHAHREKQNISVLFLDLDKFKDINDTYGHEVGDILLQEVSKKLQLCVREEDTISRLGGDEFTIIINNTDKDSILKIATKIISKMQEKTIINNVHIYTTFSIGISTYPQDGDTPNLLVRNADTAMYKAKEMGKNQYQFYTTSMTESTTKKIDMTNAIRIGLANDEFVPYFQPKIDALDEEIIGIEALVRWNHPELGLLAPDSFLEVAQESGLITQIDECMLRKSIKVLKQWLDSDLTTGKLSLNLSVKELENEDYFLKLQNIIEEMHIEAKYLELEVTEGQIMSDPETSIKILSKIRDLGVTISVDDFGTGYSSLSYLKLLPIDTLKIDASFISDLPDDKNDVAIVKAIIALAKNLQLDVIAEGVETQEQLDFLIFKGCTNIQGYYYSPPLAETECKEFLLTYK